MDDKSDPDGRPCRFLDQLVGGYFEHAIGRRIRRYLLVFIDVLGEGGVTSVAKSYTLAGRSSFVASLVIIGGHGKLVQSPAEADLTLCCNERQTKTDGKTRWLLDLQPCNYVCGVPSIEKSHSNTSLIIPRSTPNTNVWMSILR